MNRKTYVGLLITLSAFPLLLQANINLLKHLTALRLRNLPSHTFFCVHPNSIRLTFKVEPTATWLHKKSPCPEINMVVKPFSHNTVTGAATHYQQQIGSIKLPWKEIPADGPFIVG